jgi:hypothetical protein
VPKKTFTVGGSRAEPISFDLVGTDTQGNPIQPIEFRCKSELQGMVLTELFQLAQDDQTAAGLALMSTMIKQALVPEQVQLFDEIIHSDEIVVRIETLTEIGQFLLESYMGTTGNPTSAQSPSTPGSVQTSPTSVADYLSQPEPTLKPSAPIVYATPPTQ